MSVVLPKAVQLAVKQTCYRLLDEFGYMHKSRADSSLFMARLQNNPHVGKVLANYMKKEDIKTYIKDAILNRYSKDKRAKALPSDQQTLADLVTDYYGKVANSIERAGDIHLLRLGRSEDLVVVSQGTLMKWETALRKALEFIERAPGLPPQAGTLRILLNIAPLANQPTTGDRTHLKKSLEYIKVDIRFAE